MIESFSHKGLEKFFYSDTRKWIHPEQADRIKDLLDLLNSTVNVTDMDFPGADLQKLIPITEDPARQVWAVSVSGNWRIFFKFDKGDAYDVGYSYSRVISVMAPACH